MLINISKAVRKNTLLTFVAVLLLSLAIPLFSFTPDAHAQEALTGDFYGLGTNDNGDKVSLSKNQVDITWVHAGLIRIIINGKTNTPLFATPNGDGQSGYSLDDERRDTADTNKGRNYRIESLRPCYGMVQWNGGKHDEPVTSVKLDIDLKVNATDQSCPAIDGDDDEGGELKNLAIKSSENSTAYFKWVDAGTIARVDANDAPYWGKFIQNEFDESGRLFMREKEAGQNCQDFIYVSANGETMTLYEADTGYDGPIPDQFGPGNCKYRDKNPHKNGLPVSGISFVLAEQSNRDIPAGEGAISVGVGGDVDASCETGGNPLSWILCPILNGILRGIDSIFSNFISPFLRVSPIQADDGNIVFEIWKNFRTMGNIVLVFALLIAVFGQSIGGGLIDAYTVKKIMPRILVAAILINLSIYIVAAMIDIGNVLGKGIGQLITAPIPDPMFNFKLGGLTEVTLGAGVIFGLIGGIVPFLTAIGAAGSLLGTGGATGGAAVLAVGAGVKTLLLMAIMVLFPAFLVVLAVFLTLILRQAIIILLALVSPVALAMWAIPGADKYTKQWFENLMKAILIYPIVSAIFAIANLMAFILLNVDDVGNTSATRNAVADLAAIVVFIAPMAMIPFSFKFAGSILGGVSGFIQGNKGKVDALVRGDKHNQHSRYYQRRQDPNTGQVMGGLAGAIGGQAGMDYKDKKDQYASKLFRRNRATSGTPGATASASTSSPSGTPSAGTPGSTLPTPPPGYSGTGSGDDTPPPSSGDTTGSGGTSTPMPGGGSNGTSTSSSPWAPPKGSPASSSPADGSTIVGSPDRRAKTIVPNAKQAKEDERRSREEKRKERSTASPGNTPAIPPTSSNDDSTRGGPPSPSPWNPPSSGSSSEPPIVPDGNIGLDEKPGSNSTSNDTPLRDNLFTNDDGSDNTFIT